MQGTLLRAILGLLRPDKGSILIGEELVGSLEWRKKRVQTGYLNQENAKNNFPITAAEVVAIGVSGVKISDSERDYRIELSMRKTGCFQIRHNPVGKPLINVKTGAAYRQLLNFPGAHHTSSLQDVIRYNILQLNLPAENIKQ